MPERCPAGADTVEWQPFHVVDGLEPGAW
jgi:hypothetical protein